MTLNCGCLQNEDGQIVVFCRSCAAALPQRIEDHRGLLVPNPARLQARCGFATGSKAFDITKSIYKKDATEAGKDRAWGAKRGHYADQLVAERLTGKPQIGKEIYSLLERAQIEPQARSAYGLDQNCDVQESGFTHHLFIDGFGCSVDGLVGDDGLIEIKRFDAGKHIKLLEGDESVLEEHEPQVYSAFACTNRNWGDLISYCPEMHDIRDQMYIKTYWRDEGRISALECAVSDFLAEIGKRVAAIRSRTSNGHSGELITQLEGSLAMLDPSSVVRPMKRGRE